MASAVPSGHLLKKLRALMQTTSVGKIHAYIVPSGDAHQSEYIANCDGRRQFISKFTGSAGTAIVTLDKAALWTDGRYHLQASKELDLNHWILMKDGLTDTPTRSDWLKDVLDAGNLVGADPFLMSHHAWKSMSKELRSRNIQLVAVEENLIDLVWEDKLVLLSTDLPREPRPCNKLISLDLDITGKDWTTKVDELREELKKKKTGSIILTALDDIAWLLNLRGSDIDFNPVFFAYCIVTKTEVFLFIDKSKLSSPDVAKSINAVEYGKPDGLCVQLLPYDGILDFVKNKLLKEEEQQVWVSDSASHAMVDCVPKSRRYNGPSPVTNQKALKNEVEVENMRKCHIRDAAALCEYLCWLEKTIKENPNGHESLWEIQGADYLERCRKEQPRFMGLSFPSISASGPNGAVIHYHPSEETRKPINTNELYLIDSGAQYLDGTTDVTRTVHFGEPSEEERSCFTRVLQGHISLATAVFPRKTKGHQLDGFARRYLWAEGLSYLHGTGHGVGMFLNVHEGPSSISPRMSPDDPGLDVGHILSNEPGFYKDGQFGIRIESLMVAQKANTRNDFNQTGYLQFETMTLVPIQRKLIDGSLMTKDQVDWINQYHQTCREKVGAYLKERGRDDVYRWLIDQTEKMAA